MQKTSKKIDKTLFNEKSLSLLNIQELRDIGRKFNIPSPTSMKKKELIDEILKIVYGLVEVPTRNASGRRSNRQFNMENYIEKIKNNSDMVSEISNMTLDLNYGTMMVSDQSEPYGETEDIVIKVFWTDGKRCSLRACEFVESDDDIDVPKDFAKKFGLENLDVLEILESNGMFKIVSKNGEKVEDSFKDFELCGLKLKKGKTQNFYSSTKEEIKDSIEKLIEECNKSQIKLILFSKEKFAGKNITNITYNDNDDKSVIYKKIVSVIGLCKKELIASEDIVVAVECPNDIEDAMSDFDDDVKIRMRRYINEVIFEITRLGNIHINFNLERVKNY